jgi:ABC-type Fe3+/spermidine/putrescine transport system ATPase subunit
MKLIHSFALAVAMVFAVASCKTDIANSAEFTSAVDGLTKAKTQLDSLKSVWGSTTESVTTLKGQFATVTDTTATMKIGQLDQLVGSTGSMFSESESKLTEAMNTVNEIKNGTIDPATALTKVKDLAGIATTVTENLNNFSANMGQIASMKDELMKLVPATANAAATPAATTTPAGTEKK